MIDADSIFFRHVDYDEMFTNYLNNGKIYGHTVIKSDTIHKINSDCLRFFPKGDYEKVQNLTRDFTVYFWFNDIPILEKQSFMEFWDYIDLNNNFQKLETHDFDWLVYAYYLLLKGYMQLEISPMHIPSDNGSLIELQRRIPPDIFIKEYTMINPMWIQIKIDEQYMKNTFMLVHTDRWW